MQGFSRRDFLKGTAAGGVGAVGVVGVLGPTRMAYPQAIGTVRFVSTLLNELVHNIDA